MMEHQRTLKSADTLIAKLHSDDTSQAEFDSICERILTQRAIHSREHDLELLRSSIEWRSQRRFDREPSN